MLLCWLLIKPKRFRDPQYLIFAQLQTQVTGLLNKFIEVKSLLGAFSKVDIGRQLIKLKIDHPEVAQLRFGALVNKRSHPDRFLQSFILFVFW